MALNREIQEYARAVAEAVFDECYDEWGLEGGRRKQVDLDAIIASVPPPTAQHHDAPTCDIDPEEVRRALGVLVSGGETNFTALIAAAREYLRLREQPAPDVQAQECCVSAIDAFDWGDE